MAQINECCCCRRSRCPSALLAKALLWLIAIITNIAYFHRFSAAPAIPQDDHLGYWSILAPVVGALAIGSMARFGWEKMKLRRMTCPAAYVVEL